MGNELNLKVFIYFYFLARYLANKFNLAGKTEEEKADVEM